MLAAKAFHIWGSFKKYCLVFYYDMFFFMDIVAAARKKLKRHYLKHFVKIPKKEIRMKIRLYRIGLRRFQLVFEYALA